MRSSAGKKKENMRNKGITLIASMLAVVLMLGSCVRLKEVRPTSAHIESITPQGFRTVGMKVALGIHNPSVQFTVVEARALVHDNGAQVAEVTAEPVTIPRKSNDVHDVDFKVVLGKGIFKGGLSALSDWRGLADRCLVDIDVKVRLKGGASRRFVYDDIPLKMLLKNYLR